MGKATAPVGLPTSWKNGIFGLIDRLAGSAHGQRLLSKVAVVSLTSLGAGNHDDEGERTGENRLIEATCRVLGDVVALDVGANNGSWTLEMRARCTPSLVVAVEPGSAASATLRSRTAGDTRVHVVQAALGAVDETVTLFGTDQSGLQASLRPDLLHRTTYTDSQREMPSEDVQMLTVASVVGQARDAAFLPDGQAVNAVKIDTEGYELDIIKLLMRSELKDSIRLVQFEFHMHALAQGEVIADFADAFGDGFTLFRLAPQKLIPLGDLDPALANYFGFSNWVALRNEIAPGVQAAYRAADPRMRRRPEWRA